MPKKIKSFTVDEDIYNDLVSMFKRYDTGVSVSLFINNRLRALLEELTELENNLKASKNLTVPMDYIINKIVKGTHEDREIEYPERWGKKITSKTENGTLESEDVGKECAFLELEDFQIRYDAEKKGIPYELFKHTVNGIFELSKDNRYLIEKRTGEKYFPMGDALMRMVETDKDEKR